MSATITEGTLPLNFPSPEDLYCMAIYCTYENAKNNIRNFFGLLSASQGRAL